MRSILDQLPTLLGVVLGAVGAMLAKSTTDKFRWQREQATRWDHSRLEAYTAFAATIKEIHAIAFRLVAVHRPHSTAPPIDRQVGLDLLAEANIHRTTAWESLLLLGDTATVSAARIWRDAVFAVEVLARDSTWRESAWQPAVDRVDHARDEFYVAARHSLGVNLGSVAQLPFLQARRALRTGGSAEQQPT